MPDFTYIFSNPHTNLARLADINVTTFVPTRKLYFGGGMTCLI